ncbi:MAG: maltooligosyl trehalose synthase, partial [Humibacillus sp.]|nr:maltooligosyl trehalose synthase [Humibacillus sp.]
HDEKLLVTTSALRARREWPECFVGPEARYEALETTSPHAVAFGRGTPDGLDVVTVVTRLAGRLADDGGFGDATVSLPEGRWTDVLGRRTVDGGATSLSDLLGATDGLPVALLVRSQDDA